MASSGSPTYTYKELKEGEIRLLELVPDANHLTGKIRHYQTNGNPDSRTYEPVPQYTALSHHWDPKPAPGQQLPVLVLLDPNDPTKHSLYELRLRQSLWNALQAIREKMNRPPGQSKDWTRHIWVDAICIDQGSDYDKDKQLGRMGDIYNDAKAVVVWLGELDDDTRVAMAFVRNLQILSSLNEYIKNERYANDWKRLVMLTRKPWFQRLWIVQEIAAARHARFLAGDEEVSWDDFASAWSIFVSQFEQIRTMLAKSGFFAQVRDPFGEVKLYSANVLVETRGILLRKRQDGGIAEHLRSLEYLLTALSMFDVTEPHDIVYAILWLSMDASQGQKRAHEYTTHTPSIEAARDSKRTHLDPRVLRDPASGGDGNTATRNAQQVYVGNSRPRSSRSNSISSQFLTLPAVLHEQEAADALMPAETGIKIDYRQPVFDLCVQVLRHIFKTTERIDIICFHWAPPPCERDPEHNRPEAEEDHPSWLLYRQRNAYDPSLSRERSLIGNGMSTNQLYLAVRRINADPLVGKPGSNTRPYLACGHTRASKVRIEGRVLITYGYVLDEIECERGMAANAVIPWEWREELGWKSNSFLPPDKFWRTLVADKGSDGQPPPPRFRLACKWAFELGGPTDNTRRPQPRDVSLEKVRNEGDSETPLKEFLDCAIAATWNRRLFRTRRPPGVGTRQSDDESFVGLGPRELRSGDVVCVLWGCAVPVILRPIIPKLNVEGEVNGDHGCAQEGLAPTINVIGDTEDPVSSSPTRSVTETSTGKKRPPPIRTEPPFAQNYEFIGECYVHGMMNGEIFHWSDEHGRELQDFNLH